VTPAEIGGGVVVALIVDAVTGVGRRAAKIAWRGAKSGFEKVTTKVDRASYNLENQRLTARGKAMWKRLRLQAFDGATETYARLNVEIETPDGLQVRSARLPPDLLAYDLALAVRAEMGLTDQFYRLLHKPSNRELRPDEIVASVVKDGDRLQLVRNGLRAWT
jgi:hypothetical protein